MLFLYSGKKLRHLLKETPKKEEKKSNVNFWMSDKICETCDSSRRIINLARKERKSSMCVENNKEDFSSLIPGLDGLVLVELSLGDTAERDRGEHDGQ